MENPEKDILNEGIENNEDSIKDEGVEGSIYTSIVGKDGNLRVFRSQEEYDDYLEGERAA